VIACKQLRWLCSLKADSDCSMLKASLLVLLLCCHIHITLPLIHSSPSLVVEWSCTSDRNLPRTGTATIITAASNVLRLRGSGLAIEQQLAAKGDSLMSLLAEADAAHAVVKAPQAAYSRDLKVKMRATVRGHRTPKKMLVTPEEVLAGVLESNITLSKRAQAANKTTAKAKPPREVDAGHEQSPVINAAHAGKSRGERQLEKAPISDKGSRTQTADDPRKGADGAAALTQGSRLDQKEPESEMDEAFSGPLESDFNQEFDGEEVGNGGGGADTRTRSHEREEPAAEVEPSSKSESTDRGEEEEDGAATEAQKEDPFKKVQVASVARNLFKKHRNLVARSIAAPDDNPITPLFAGRGRGRGRGQPFARGGARGARGARGTLRQGKPWVWVRPGANAGLGNPKHTRFEQTE